jgi:quinolinate synthase
MKRLAPEKQLIEAPTAGKGATCESCAHCPWRVMNSLQKLAEVLATGANEITIDPAVRDQAIIPINRMLEFAGQPF